MISWSILSNNERGTVDRLLHYEPYMSILTIICFAMILNFYIIVSSLLYFHSLTIASLLLRHTSMNIASPFLVHFFTIFLVQSN